LIFLRNFAVLKPWVAVSFKQNVIRKTRSASNWVNTVIAVFNTTDCANKSIKEIVFVTVIAFPE